MTHSAGGEPPPVDAPETAQPTEGSENAQRETWIELVLNVVAPTIVMVFLSREDRLGPQLALVLGLSFPLMHVVRSRWTSQEISPLSIIAVPSVLLTGGIGLAELDPKWFQVKEAVMPLVLAVFVQASRSTPYAVVDTMIFRMFDRPKLERVLLENDKQDILEPLMTLLNRAFLAGFLYSAVASYFLAGYLVTSPSGTPEFTSQIGQFTFISFPVVGLPMTAVMGIALNKMMNEIEAATGQQMDDFLRPGLGPKKPASSDERSDQP